MDADTANPWFVADQRGYYRVELVVDDGTANSRPVRQAILRVSQLNVPAEYATLEDALQKAQNGDVIRLAAGTYQERFLPGELRVTLQGDGLGATVLEAPEGVDPIVTLEPGGNLTLRDITLAGANSSFGGALTCFEATLAATNVEVRRSVAREGGGMYLENCESTLRDVNFIDNGAADSGGGLHAEGGVLSWIGGIVADNFSGNEGGGVYVASNELEMRNLQVYRNLSVGTGPGVHIETVIQYPEGINTVDHMTFAGNVGSAAPSTTGICRPFTSRTAFSSTRARLAWRWAASFPREATAASSAMSWATRALAPWMTQPTAP